MSRRQIYNLLLTFQKFNMNNLTATEFKTPVLKVIININKALVIPRRKVQTIN